MAVETASAAIVLTSSHLGMALSTTHVAAGSILGTSGGRTGSGVRWGVAGCMAITWVLAPPAAGAAVGRPRRGADGIVVIVFGKQLFG